MFSLYPIIVFFSETILKVTKVKKKQKEVKNTGQSYLIVLVELFTVYLRTYWCLDNLRSYKSPGQISALQEYDRTRPKNVTTIN